MTVISGTPAYIQVAADLRSQIESGKLRPGDKLLSSAELRAKYAVSNTVIRDAVNELRRAGFIVGQQGKGVFVTSKVPVSADTPPSELAVQELREQVADLRALVIDLYARLGFPVPLKAPKEDASRTSDPVALSFPIPIGEALLSRAHDKSDDPLQEDSVQQADVASESGGQESRGPGTRAPSH
jgi:DNA-binding transcriptional regulator YhcF (GntR family)